MTKPINPVLLSADPKSLKPNPWNPNKVGPEMELRLEESMRRNGCYKPVVCRELPDGSLEIIGGEHRARTAARLGLATVPVVNLGRIDEKKAKEIGLIDNGRYGEDDPLLLGEILRELGVEDVMSYLPYQTEDLAGLFSASSIDLDDLSIDGEDDKLAGVGADPAERAVMTHTVLRFKVPVAEQEKLNAYIEHVIRREGLKESDQMLTAGMALMSIFAAAKEIL